MSASLKELAGSNRAYSAGMSSPMKAFARSSDSWSYLGLIGPSRDTVPSCILCPWGFCLLCHSGPFSSLGCQMQVQTESQNDHCLRALPLYSEVFVAQTQRGPIPSHASRWALRQRGACPKMSLIRTNFASRLPIFSALFFGENKWKIAKNPFLFPYLFFTPFPLFFPPLKRFF